MLVHVLILALLRFPSLAAGSECLGGSSYSSPLRFCVRHRWDLFVWLSGP